MDAIYEDYLFTRGYFVSAGTDAPTAPETLLALAKLFGVELKKGAAQASPEMLRVAERNLGLAVPEPFYRGFPASVRTLGPDRKLLDQLLHYLTTYGFGFFDAPGHSLFEGELRRAVFDEDTPVREMAAIPPAEALALLRETADAICAGTRPADGTRYALLLVLIRNGDYTVTHCACADTVARLLTDTRDLRYASFLKLSQVMALAERLQADADAHAAELSFRFLPETGAPARRAFRLKLPNRDRVLLAKTLDTVFVGGNTDEKVCFEKRARWAGLLHHIHYKPKNDAARAFADAVRGGRKASRSGYSAFERALAAGDAPLAARALKAEKGEGALTRRLLALLSRCKNEAETEEILSLVGTKNRLLLLQLLTALARETPKGPRTFAFTRLGTQAVHWETEAETARRRSRIGEETAAALRRSLRDKFADACRGSLGKVWADPDLRRIALPVQEGAAMGGADVLPRGSRLPLPEGKTLRCFVYWEKVNDIDLSVQAINAEGGLLEFSWRTMYGNKHGAILYSGDQTSGYRGGSEYFDIDLKALRAERPGLRTLLFCANVYSDSAFDGCFCRAGYMLREKPDSGEVYEPKTVRTAFRVTGRGDFVCLFAVDLRTNDFVWINTAFGRRLRVAGEADLSYLEQYLGATEAMDLYTFARLLATEVADDPADADVVFSDRTLPLAPGARQIRSCDTEQVIALLNG